MLEWLAARNFSWGLQATQYSRLRCAAEQRIRTTGKFFGLHYWVWVHCHLSAEVSLSPPLSLSLFLSFSGEISSCSYWWHQVSELGSVLWASACHRSDLPLRFGPFSRVFLTRRFTSACAGPAARSGRWLGAGASHGSCGARHGSG